MLALYFKRMVQCLLSFQQCWIKQVSPLSGGKKVKDTVKLLKSVAFVISVSRLSENYILMHAHKAHDWNTQVKLSPKAFKILSLGWQDNLRNKSASHTSMIT